MWILGQVMRWACTAIGIFFLVGCVISIYMNSDETYWRDVFEGLAVGAVIICITLLFYI